MLQAEQILQDRYQLKEQLGRTGAGRQTWLVKDLQAEEQVVVKLLAFSPEMQWEELKLFEREAQVLQSLAHPCIPRYRDYFSLEREAGGGVPWFGLVQDYIAGSSFQELLERGHRFSEQQVQRTAIEGLEILIYLHQLSPPVLHRDIKPSNLILGEDQKVYLVDFGAVQAQAAVTGVTFTVVGTSGYAPLEQFWGRAVPSSDVYALGATLIHLLTGVAPAQLPQKEGCIQFSDRINIQANFVNWLEKMTNIAVEKRFASAQEALQALKEPQLQPSPSYKPRKIKITHPSRTAIKLHKGTEKLHILIPAMGLNKLTTHSLISALFRLGLTGYLIVILIKLVFSSWFWLIPLGTLLFLLVNYLGEEIHIYFDRESFQQESKALFFTYNQKKGKIADILTVFLNNKGVLYEVNIRCQNKIYSLGGGLSEEEGAWLIQEIQNWLEAES